ncbi:MAG: hypothetical protein R6U15_08345 [Candidatus Izemoplasmatales bacterium]
MVRKKIKKKSELDKFKEEIRNLLDLAEKDKKKFLEIQKKLADDVNKISFQLVKNEGAVAILKKILEDK